MNWACHSHKFSREFTSKNNPRSFLQRCPTEIAPYAGEAKCLVIHFAMVIQGYPHTFRIYLYEYKHNNTYLFIYIYIHIINVCVDMYTCIYIHTYICAAAKLAFFFLVSKDHQRWPGGERRRLLSRDGYGSKVGTSKIGWLKWLKYVKIILKIDWIFSSS